MATIKLSRTSEFINRIRDYQIYIDGQKIGSIANGEMKEFQTTKGQHTIVAKIDWCLSPAIAFNIDESQTIKLKVGGFKNGNWIMPIGFVLIFIGYIFNFEWTLFVALPILATLFYYLTIGRKNYLTFSIIDIV